MGRRPRVHLHLVPRGTGAYPGLNGAFVIATPPESGDIAYLDNQLQGTIVERKVDVHSLQQIWESVRAEAMPHGGHPGGDFGGGSGMDLTGAVWRRAPAAAATQATAWRLPTTCRASWASGTARTGRGRC